MNEIYARRRDLVVGALREIGVDVDAAEGHDLRLGAGAGRPHLDLVRRAGARGGRGRRLAGLDVRAERRGLLPDLADDARRAARRGDRAASRAPLLRLSEPRPSASSASPYERRYGFSRAVRAGDRVIVAGTAPVWPDGSCDPDPAAQARRCCEIIVAAAGELRARGRWSAPDADHRPEVADAVGGCHREYFGAAAPAATMVVVAGLLDPRWVGDRGRGLPG